MEELEQIDRVVADGLLYDFREAHEARARRQLEERHLGPLERYKEIREHSRQLPTGRARVQAEREAFERLEASGKQAMAPWFWLDGFPLFASQTVALALTWLLLVPITVVLMINNHAILTFTGLLAIAIAFFVTFKTDSGAPFTETLLARRRLSRALKDI